MTDPVSKAEIEDVLSSIRRLVSDEPDALRRKRRTRAAEEDRLVLTPAQRVAEQADAEERDPGPDAAWQPAAGDAPDLSEIAHLDDRRDSDTAAPEGPDADAAAADSQSLKDRIAGLEAALVESGGEWEPDGSETGECDETRPLSADTGADFAEAWEREEAELALAAAGGDVPETDAAGQSDNAPEADAAETVDVAAEQGTPPETEEIAAAEDATAETVEIAAEAGAATETDEIAAKEGAAADTVENAAEAGAAAEAVEIAAEEDGVSESTEPEAIESVEAGAEEDSVAAQASVLAAGDDAQADMDAGGAPEAVSEEMSRDAADSDANRPDAALVDADSQEASAQAETPDHAESDDATQNAPETAEVPGAPVAEDDPQPARSVQDALTEMAASAALSEALDGPAATDWEDWESGRDDPAADAEPDRPEPREAPIAADAPASAQEEDDDGFNLYAEEEALIDEEALRDMVAGFVREELQGVLGERITRNVRRLVRREIERALAMRDLQ